MSYFVGSVVNAANMFSTFLVGEYVTEDDTSVTIRNLVKVIENAQPAAGRGLQIQNMFIVDEFFTSETLAKIEKSKLIVSKILDPEKDAKMIRNLETQYTGIRTARSGLVSAAAAPQLMTTMDRSSK